MFRTCWNALHKILTIIKHYIWFNRILLNTNHVICLRLHVLVHRDIIVIIIKIYTHAWVYAFKIVGKCNNLHFTQNIQIKKHAIFILDEINKKCYQMLRLIKKNARRCKQVCALNLQICSIIPLIIQKKKLYLLISFWFINNEQNVIVSISNTNKNIGYFFNLLGD